MDSMKHGSLDVSVLRGDHPRNDYIPRLQLRDVGDLLEIELPHTGHKRVEIELAGFVVSVGFSAPKYLPPSETTDTAPLAHIRREI